eukprot:3721704-Rhodomonas_salina.1
MDARASVQSISMRQSDGQSRREKIHARAARGRPSRLGVASADVLAGAVDEGRVLVDACGSAFGQSSFQKKVMSFRCVTACTSSRPFCVCTRTDDGTTSGNLLSSVRTFFALLCPLSAGSASACPSSSRIRSTNPKSSARSAICFGDSSPTIPLFKLASFLTALFHFAPVSAKVIPPASRGGINFKNAKIATRRINVSASIVSNLASKRPAPSLIGGCTQSYMTVGKLCSTCSSLPSSSSSAAAS